MKLSDLIRELAALDAAGYGDRLVIDNNGNDVADVHAPTSHPGDRPGPHPYAEECSIMLGCHIDYDLRRQS